MTGQNKLIGGALALTIAAQFCHGIFSVFWFAFGPRKYPNHLTVRAWTHRFLAAPFPEINLDPFKLCGLGQWRLGELMYYNLAISFGKSSPVTLQPTALFHPGGYDTSHVPHSPPRGIIDLLAFSIILVTARRSRRIGYPGMPSILDAIVRNSTQYFIFIFFTQISSLLSIFFTPVGDR